MVGNKAQKAVAAALTGMMVLGSAAPAFAEPNWKRVAGDSRYGTMYEAVMQNEEDNAWGTFVAANGGYFKVNEEGKEIKVDPAGVTKDQLKALSGLGIVSWDSDVENVTTNTIIYLLKGEVHPNALTGDALAGWTWLTGAQTKMVDGKDKVEAVSKYLVDSDYTRLNTLVVVSGEKAADALTASSLAGTFRAPIVSTSSKGLTDEAKAVIDFYWQKLVDQYNGKVSANDTLRVFVVGGTAAVSSDVADYVNKLVADVNDYITTDSENEMAYGRAVTIAGADRVATSLAVAEDEFDYFMADASQFLGTKDPMSWDNWDKQIIITNGTAWADGVSVSAFSYRNATPVLLTKADGTLSEEQVAFLQKVNEDRRGNSQLNVMVVGGPAEASADQLNALGFKNSRIRVIKGDDRYDTSAEFIKFAGAFNNIAVATGHDFADALVGGAFVGARGGEVALVGEPGDANYDKAAKEIVYQAKGSGNRGFILGGTSAVSSTMEAHLEVLV